MHPSHGQLCHLILLMLGRPVVINIRATRPGEMVLLTIESLLRAVEQLNGSAGGECHLDKNVVSVLLP